MKRPVFLIFTNAMILIVIFCLLAESLVIIPRLAMTDSAHGKVEVRRGGHGDWTPLSAGIAVKTGDVVRTGSSSDAEFVYAGGTRMKLMANSQMTIAKASYNSVKKAEDSELRLTTGKVFVRIMKSLTPASSFQVETPTAVAAVRGTIFSVEAKNGHTEVAVWKGKVQVTRADGKDKTAITPGRCAEVAQTGDVETENAARLAPIFQRESSIVKPHLVFEVQPTSEGKGLLRGQTEVGDTLTVNGQPQRVLGNGAFIKILTLKPGTNTITVTSKDKHDAVSTLSKTVQEGK